MWGSYISELKLLWNLTLLSMRKAKKEARVPLGTNLRGRCSFLTQPTLKHSTTHTCQSSRIRWVLLQGRQRISWPRMIAQRHQMTGRHWHATILTTTLSRTSLQRLEVGLVATTLRMWLRRTPASSLLASRQHHRFRRWGPSTTLLSMRKNNDKRPHWNTKSQPFQ